MIHDHCIKIDKKKHNKIYFAFFATLIFAFVEFWGGHVYNSLALKADAGHMLTDSIGLMIAAIAALMSTKPANKTHTFGISKVEVIAAMLNLVLVGIVIIHIFEDFLSRIGNSVELNGSGILIVATLGLIINIVVFVLLHHGEENLNTKAAKLHVLGDLLGSVAAIFSGLMIYFFNLAWFDPLMSLIVCIILLKMAINLSKEMISIILDAVPEGINVEDVKKSILEIDNVIHIHDLHIWKSANKEISLTAHLDLRELDLWSDNLKEINNLLKRKFEITHVTLQPEIDFICEVK